MNQFSRMFFVCFFLFLSAFGCATAKFIQTGNQYPPYNGVVKIYRNNPPDTKYEEIGWISSSGGMIHEWTHLIEAMQSKAALKGANGIILIDKENTSTGFATYNPQYGLVAAQGTQKSLMAIAIRTEE
jgi:hypothetical protein